MYLPGCPPRPEMLIDAILKLHHKIMNEPLGPKRAAKLADQKVELVPSSQQVRTMSDPRDDRDCRRAGDQPAPRPAGDPSRRRRSASSSTACSASAASGDTSGFGGLVREPLARAGAERPVRRLLRRGRRRPARRPTPSSRAAVSTDRRRPRRADPARRARAPARRGRRPCATTRRCASSCCASVSGVDYLGTEQPAARGLSPDLDDLPPPDPARGRGQRRRPARPVGRPRSTRRPTGRSARPGTCSASSSTATRR